MADRELNIEVAAKIRDGGAAVAQLNAIASSLDVATTAAGAAATVAAEAQRSYSKVASEASGAADAVSKSGDAIAAQREKMASAMNAGDADGFWKAVPALQALEAKQASLTAKATAAKAALSSEADALASLKSKASEAGAAEDKLAKAQSKLVDEQKDALKAQMDADKAAAGSGKANEAAEAFAKLGGPLGRMGQQAFGAADGLKKMSAALGSAGPYVAVAVAIVLITTAIIAATVAVAKWSIGLADANRNQVLSIKGLAASSDAMSELVNILPGVQKRTGLASEEIAKLAEQLAAAGVKAKDMPSALQAVATATAAGASGAFLSKLNAELAAGAGLSAETSAALTKMEAIAKQKMLSLDAQAARFKTNISDLFGGVKIDGFLEALSSLVGLFDKNTAAGQTMKFLFESIMQPLIDGATKAIPVLEGMLIRGAIYALKAYVALKKVGDALDISGKEAGFDLVFGIIGAIVAVAGLLGAVVVAVGASILLALSPFIIVGLAIYGVIMGIVTAGEMLITGFSNMGAAISGAFSSAVAWLQSLDLSSMGGDLIVGLANGIVANAASVISAITGAVGGAISAAKHMLGIASPSKVFAKIGGHTAEGMAEGVDDGAGDVQSSLESMVSPPDAAGAAGAAGAPGKAGAGTKFGDVKIDIKIDGAGGDGQSIALQIKQALIDLFDGDGLTTGA